jgi:hypothetical protein
MKTHPTVLNYVLDILTHVILYLLWILNRIAPLDQNPDIFLKTAVIGPFVYTRRSALIGHGAVFGR